MNTSLVRHANTATTHIVLEELTAIHHQQPPPSLSIDQTITTMASMLFFFQAGSTRHASFEIKYNAQIRAYTVHWPASRQPTTAAITLWNPLLHARTMARIRPSGSRIST